MTRKDFRIIAEALRSTRPTDRPEADRQYRKVVLALADALAATNPQFNRTTFKVACGW